MVRTSVAVAALALALEIAVFARHPTPLPAQLDDIPEDPLVLFGKLMPVFTSPRCANCHGFTDAVTGKNHPDKVEPKSCDSCHTAVDWHLAPSDMQWAGTTTREMCRILSDAAVSLRSH